MSSLLINPKNTLVDHLFKTSQTTRDIIVVLVGAGLTALAAKFIIPVEPVPFYLSPLVVLLCGLSMGAKRGALSQIAYLAAGASGLPVFAKGGGVQYLITPTAGYIFSFVITALVVGALAERDWDRNPFKLTAALVLGNLINLGLGALWLSNFIGIEKAFQAGFLPFILTNAVQSALAVILLPVAWKFIKH